MNKKHYLILGIISIVLSVLFLLMAFLTKNGSDPLGIQINKDKESEIATDVNS